MTQTGRPTKIETHGPRFLEYVKAGMGPKAAAAKADVAYQTVRNWISAGEDVAAKIREHAEIVDGEEVTTYEPTEREAAYLEFLDRFTRDQLNLLARVEVEISRRVTDPSTPMRDLLDVARRLDPERWSQDPTIKIKHSGGVTVDDRRVRETLDDRISAYEQAFAELEP